MSFQPKDDSPEFSWLCHASELQALTDPDDPQYDLALRMLWNQDFEYFDVGVFCSTQPGNPDPVTEFDLISGDHVAKFKQAARQALFYRLCEEV